MTFWQEVWSIVIGICIANILDWLAHKAILEKFTFKFFW